MGPAGSRSSVDRPLHKLLVRPIYLVMEKMTLYEYFRPFLLIAVGFLLNEFLHRNRAKRNSEASSK